MKGKRFLSAALLLLFLFGFSQVFSAIAADFDAEKVGSLHISLKTSDGQPAPNARLQVYRVGEWNGSGGFSPTGDFADSGLELNDLTGDALAQALDALCRDVQPYADAVSDADGEAMFLELPTGLYLVRQNGFARISRFRQIQPFLVSLPMTHNSEWVYQIEASPKVEIGAQPGVPSFPPYSPGEAPDPTPGGDDAQPDVPVIGGDDAQPDDPTSGGDDAQPDVPNPGDDDTRTDDPTVGDGDTLPQTGLLLWPVFALGVCGVLLFGVGCILTASAKKRDRNA